MDLDGRRQRGEKEKGGGGGGDDGLGPGEVGERMQGEGPILREGHLAEGRKHEK